MECIILSLNIHLLNQNQKMKKQCVISLLVYESDTKKYVLHFLTSILCWDQKRELKRVRVWTWFWYSSHYIIGNMFFFISWFWFPYWILKEGMIHRLKCQPGFPSLEDGGDKDISLNSTMIVFQWIIKKTNLRLFH